MGSFDGSLKIDTRLDSKGFNQGVKGIMSSLKGVAAAVGIAFGIKAIADFSRASLEASSKMESAWIGLQSIAEGQGRSFTKAKSFIQDYISDGLIPATDAVTTYKNLAMRGYDDGQIEQTMLRLKDASAFGRQASLSMGEAVASASEGLKNENSILVDNSGITKNVSMMWKEYADSIGVGVQSLTKQQKIQAEVNGIMQESKFQVGDSAKVLNTYAGQVAQLEFNFTNLKVAFGNFLKPIMQVVMPAINVIIAGLTKVFNVWAAVSQALFGKQISYQQQTANTADSAANATNGLAGSMDNVADSTKKAQKAAKGALASFDNLNVLNSPTPEAPDSGGSSGGGGSVGGGDALIPPIIEETTIDPAIEKMIQGIKDMLKPLQDINFDNLSAAFDRLKKALEPFGAYLFEGLEWAYYNIFVPLAKWTIEDLLPAFLDLLSEALGFLSSVIEALKPLAMWLWDTFLLPIAKWTGGLIVTVLEGLADALKGISDWINENQTLFATMTVIVAGFFGVWKLSSIIVAFTEIKASFGTLSALKGLVLDNSKVAQKLFLAFGNVKSGLSTAMATMKTAWTIVKEGTIALVKQAAAWVTSTAKTIASTVAGWADVAVKGAQATATWLLNTALVQQAIEWLTNTAQMITSTVAGWADVAVKGAQTAATWLLNAALTVLLSPIAWVVAAIAGVIAIGYLLVENWDEIKEACGRVWDWIKEKFQAFDDWLTDIFSTDWSKNFGFLGEILNGFFKGISDIWESIKKIFGGIVDFISGVFSGDWSKAWQGIQNIFKGIFDGFVAIVKAPLNVCIGLINGLVEGVNWVIGKINDISVDIPDWLGGGHIGFDLGYLSEVPYLAKGAVIPANRPFTAVLGDQTSGRNLEAPEGLIRKIVREETGGMSQGQTVIHINATGDMATFVKLLRYEIKKEDRRAGVSLVTGGI